MKNKNLIIGLIIVVVVYILYKSSKNSSNKHEEGLLTIYNKDFNLLEITLSSSSAESSFYASIEDGSQSAIYTVVSGRYSYVVTDFSTKEVIKRGTITIPKSPSPDNLNSVTLKI